MIGNLAWHPDGNRIAFSATSDEQGQSIYVRSAAGNDTPQLLRAADGDEELETFDWSPDGEFLAVNRHVYGGGGADVVDLVMLDVASGELTPFATTPAREHSPTFSPDGRWVLFESDESGRFEIYVARFPAADTDGNPGKLRVSAGGGKFGEWSADGRTIWFTSLDGELKGVDVDTEGDSLRFGNARPLLDLRDLSLVVPTAQDWQPLPDGSGFAFLREDKPPASRHIQVVLDWDLELRRLVNVGK